MIKIGEYLIMRLGKIYLCSKLLNWVENESITAKKIKGM